MSRIAVLVASLLALLVPAPVRAAFHIAVIDEVMSGVNNGTISNSNIQYVEVRQLSAGQNNVCHTRLTVFKCLANGGGFQVLIDNLGGAGAMEPCVPNPAAGARWIMASPDGATFLAASGITPDAIWNNAATGRIPTSCGMVCWGAPSGILPPSDPSTWNAGLPSDYIDCVAYGNYDGTAEPLGNPAASDTPGGGTFSLTRTGDVMFSNGFHLACPSPTSNPAQATGNFGPCTPTTTTRPVPTTSSTTTTTTTRTTTTTTPPPICGDVNGDGVVNIGDALVMAQFDVGLRQCGMAPFSQPTVCDVNGDAACNIGDALKMAQCDVGLISCAFTCRSFACP